MKNQLDALAGNEKDQQGLLMSILENLQDSYFRADSSGNLIFANPRASGMFGYSLEEMIGMPAARLYADPENRKKLTEKVREAGQVRDWVSRGLRKDGTAFWVSMNVQLLHDEQGSIVGTEGVVRDITDRKQAESVLAENELKYRQVVNNASQAIFVVQGARLVYLNPMTSTMIGYSSEEAMARPFTEFIHPDDRDMVVERQTGRMKGEDVPPVYSFRIVRADGAVRWAELNAVLIDWQGGPATLNFLSDITERMSAETERERLLKHQLVLNRITLTLGASMGLTSTLRTLRNEIQSLLDADGFFVSRYHKETGLITALFIVDEGVERDVSTFPSDSAC